MPLPLEFTRKLPGSSISRLRYTQVKRTGNIALYQFGRIDPGFEVVRIRIAKPHSLPSGSSLPWHEVYPSTEDFGRDGWYYRHEEDALKKFHELAEASEK
ncbi:hypothetical protein AW736_00560 [Termitidicoccus mucosus]|uniref:Uncharacterized protein n=1 Tax=Termitidicoccus mucosus TaxID=1184151 RepID=A0A178IKY5_9BACT|nr:hypothetical protein AW736_00560 [Opitutaceae bacterium TSB47]